MKNNIILITDNGNITQKMQKSIFLLREKDCFESIRPNNCFEIIKEKKPSVIFYHYTKTDNEIEDYKNTENLYNFITKVKQNPVLNNSSIILLYDRIDEDVLCGAFEKGISDFLPTFASDTELTIRTLWSIQKKESQIEYKKKTNILSKLNIIDAKNNVYTEKYIQEILREENLKNWGTFVALAPDVNIRSKISPQALMSSVKSIVRTNDILGYASDFKIYLWFREAKKEDVEKILEKLKKLLTSNFPICAGYIEVRDIEFDVAEEIANRALSKALLRGNSFICGKESDKKEQSQEKTSTNYKLYKDNFLKKLESILSPLFFQTQKINEQKLFKTKIKQEVNKEKSFFQLKNDFGKSSFFVSYSGFTKVKIEIIHELTEEEPSLKKIFIDSEELTEQKIEFLLNEFIKEFKRYTKY